MFLKTLGVGFSLALASCAATAQLSSPVETAPSGAKINFLDISKFDRDLSGSLQDRNSSVEVAFFKRVSPNNVPERLQKWIFAVEDDGEQILVEPPPNELISRSPMAAISLVGTLFTSSEGFAKLNSERVYESAKGRDAVITLERNNKGEVVINAIKFIKRAP